MCKPFSLLKRRRLVGEPAEGFRSYHDQMHREGFTFFDKGLDPALVEIVCTELRNRADAHVQARESGNKDFWNHLIGRDELTSNHPFVRMMLQKNVIDIASSYLGEVPYLADIDAVVSLPMENEPAWKSSQLWHQDFDDRKIIKLFIYCNDVDSEDDGPFTFLPKHVSTRVPSHLSHKRIDDRKMMELAKEEDIRRVMGKAGTAFFIDSRNCLHLGSRVAPGHKRIAFMGLFVSFVSLWPFNNNITINHALTERERLVLRK